ncbi:hypothetical protein [Neisseria cinerea]|uniref:hypothetical protein n=1 Tax=Neisseria cinerea TaxID=483 RepID=UPI000D2FF97C|nr:hypothetical protein [Neisseria cinerea]
MDTIQDDLQKKITFQMGLNLQKYQEIERILKHIISISSKTIHITHPTKSLSNSKPVNIWSDQADITKTTLGNLFAQLEKTEHKPNYEDHCIDNPELTQLSFSYHIPTVCFIDREIFYLDFKQVVQDRNMFIHNFSNEMHPKDVLCKLKEEYNRADRFQENHLNTLTKMVDNVLSEIINQAKIMIFNYGKLSACDVLDEIYQKRKRKDGWALWTSIIQEMQREHPLILSSLKQESLLVGKNVALYKIFQEAYPRWQFMQEDLPKGTKRLLVKVDNRELNLREELD